MNYLLYVPRFSTYTQSLILSEACRPARPGRHAAVKHPHRSKQSESCRSHVGLISDLHDTYLVEASTSAATCEQEPYSIGKDF